MPLQVAICDDEKKICSELEALLRKILVASNVKHEIDVFFSGENLCRKMESQAHYDLIFLDIEFAKAEINGVEVGKRIRDTYESHTVSIVYISWEEKYSMQLFKVRPLDFLIKPLDYEQVDQVVQTYLRLFRMETDDFVYRVRLELHRVKIKDIVFLESINRKLILHLAGGTKKVFYGTLKDVFSEQLQNANFLHTHVSYIVNYNYVTALTRNSVVLSTGKELPISRQKKDEVEEAYFAIMERRGVM